MCVCVCEARDLSSGAAFTGEKVKFTDLRRQEDILFGPKKKKCMKKWKGHFIQYFLKKLKIPSERQRQGKESSEIRASVVPL